MLLTDTEGTPLGVTLTSASPHDVTLIEPLLDSTVHQGPAPKRLVYDKAADSGRLRACLKERGLRLICPFIRRRNQKPKRMPLRDQKHYKHRWKIERTFGWLKNYRRLTTRWEYLPQLHLGFWQLACLFTILKRF
jgi:transposase